MDQEVAAGVEQLAAVITGPERGSFADALEALRPAFVTAFRRNWSVVRPAGERLGQALSRVAVQPASSYLEALAADPALEMRCLAAHALGYWGQNHPHESISFAYRLAADESWEVRETVANAFDDLIGRHHPQFVFELMAEWTRDPNPNVRRVPTNALMRYGRKHPIEVLDLMERLLHDDSDYVRRNVAFCLQQSIGKVKHPILGPTSPKSPRLLLARLELWSRDEDPRARWIVATTIGNVWASDFIEQALPILESLAGDEHRPVRTAVGKALKVLAKYRPTEVAVALQRWEGDGVHPASELAQRLLKGLPAG